MRQFIYNRIKDIAGLSTIVGDRVISSGAADNPVEPFIIVQMGIELPPLGLAKEAGAQSVPFSCWVHDKPGSMLRIDEACVLLKYGIPTDVGAKVGNMSHYGIEWVETGGDAFDDHYGTNTREVMFTMMTRR